MKNILIGLVIVSPMVFLGLLVYNPSEKAALARDARRRQTIDILARALEARLKEDGVYPADLGVLEYKPAELSKYTYKVSGDGQNIVIYTKNESLANRQYCGDSASLTVYSSADNRTAITCNPSPTPGSQEFVD